MGNTNNQIQYRYANDGSRKPPRIELQQSMWGMMGIGENGQEWSTERKLEQLSEAGFTGIAGGVPQPEDAEKWRRWLDDYDFSFGTAIIAGTIEELVPYLKKAKDFGALYVNIQVLDNYIVGNQAVALLKSMVDEAEKVGIPLFVETHRGRITQDVIRTVEYIRAIPEMMINIDFSHYIVSGEMVGFANETAKTAETYFDQLLERAACAHARISNGQQVQVDVGENAEHPQVENFMRWWEKGMEHFLEHAGPGDIFPFVSELGPPPYSITKTSYKPSYDTEISDRWSQALVMKRLGQQAWENASRKKGAIHLTP